MARFGIFLVVSWRYFGGTFFSCYFSSKLTSPVFSGLCSVMEENEVSLKRSHQPSHDTPGKPRSKRRSSVSSVSTPVRRSISSSFSSKTTARSLAQRVRFKDLSHYVCRVYSWLLFCVHYHLENDGLIDLCYKLWKKLVLKICYY